MRKRKELRQRGGGAQGAVEGRSRANWTKEKSEDEEAGKSYGWELRDGGVGDVFNFLTKALAVQTNVFSGAH